MNKLKVVRKGLISVFLTVPILPLLFLAIASAQQWARTYGGAKNDYVNSIQQTRDGGYVVAGLTTSFGAGGEDAWALKLDGNGNVQWQKAYGGISNNWAYSVRQTTDGGYVVAGMTKSFGAGGGDAWVLKLDGNGNVQWQKAYGGTKNDWANSVEQTSDGGYVIAAYTGSFGVGGEDVLIMKLDTKGEIPYCGAMRTSNAIVNNTNAIISKTDVIGRDTSVSPRISTASVANISATVTEVCPVPNKIRNVP